MNRKYIFLFSQCFSTINCEGMRRDGWGSSRLKEIEDVHQLYFMNPFVTQLKQKNIIISLNFNWIFNIKELFYLWLHCTACGIFVPRPGIQPVHPSVEVQSPNHWTTRKAPENYIFNFIEV